MTTYDDDNVELDENPPEETSNRTFLLVAGILGGLVFLALLCLVGYFFFANNANQQNEATARAQATQQAATIQVGLTQRAQSQALTQTAAVTNTVPPTNTPVIAQATATIATATATANAVTATVGAAYTQLAISTQTIIPTSTALPNTGFADEVGAPTLMVIAVVLIAVIFLVRRLRSSPSQ